MTLAILIPTLPEEYSINKLQRLNNIIDPQIERFPQVTKHIHDAGRSMPTGTKRNELIKNTDSDYFVFIDCDDVVPVYYLDEIIKAIEQGRPDVVTFIGYMTTNGNNRRNFTIKLGSDYNERAGHYYRWPNHLCVFKRSVVESVKFPDIWQREDYEWSKRVRDKGLLKTEVHIAKDMYVYDFWDQNKRNARPAKVR